MASAGDLERITARIVELMNDGIGDLSGPAWDLLHREHRRVKAELSQLYERLAPLRSEPSPQE
jgi:hypothetical protein